jgi:hypothetical protein
MTDRLCALQDAVGRVEACPGARCPFWEPGGAVIAGGCLIERLTLDLGRRPGLCHYLLELRLALDEGRADPPGTRQLFYRLSRESSPAV